MKFVGKIDVIDPIEKEPIAADDVVILELDGIVFAAVEIVKAELISLRCFGSSH